MYGHFTQREALVMMDIGTIMFAMSCMHVRSCVGDVIYIYRIEFVMR
jgi:hypothetical protein